MGEGMREARFLDGRFRGLAPFLLLFLLLLSPPVGLSLGETFNLYTERVELSGDGSSGPYRLPHPFLLRDTEEVLLAGMKVEKGDDYSIDYTRGEITFSSRIELGTKIEVSYWFFPFAIKDSYRKDLPVLPAGAEVGREQGGALPEPAPREETEAELALIGSRSLGVSFGSGKEPSFAQSLRVNIDGRISEGVALKAALSDEGTSLLPEGTTERLSELDKVFVQVRGGGWGATLGDCDLSLPESRFGKVERRLEGAVVTGRSDWGEMSVAGARAEGEFVTSRLMGIEGKQGPYRLIPEGKSEDIVVVPGSEKVYLDGERLTRGEKNDYTVDYSTAEITFTQKRLITRDSRILVDYEYSTGSYRRGLFSASTDLNLLGEKFKLGGVLFREGDEGDSPLGFSLTKERREALRGAGDDSSAAWLGGGVFVGDGKGSYALRDSIYEYVGYQKGDYEVSFTRTEEGDYQFDPALGGYRWVGDGQGEYAARVRVPLPSELSLLAMTGEAELVPGLELSGEYAGSLEDQNTFSPGRGVWGMGKRLSLSLTRWDRLSLRAATSSTEERFRFPGRIHPVGYEERWEAYPGGRERLKEIEGKVTPLSFLELRATRGELETDGGRAVNNGVGGRVGESFPCLLFAYDKLRRSGSNPLEKTRGEVSGEHRLGRVQPGVSFSQETTVSPSDSGRSYSEVGGGLKFLGLGPLSAHLSSQLRMDRVADTLGTWVRESNTWTEKLGLSLPRWRGGYVSLDLSHRKRKFESSIAGEDLVFALASLDAGYAPASDLIRLESSYDVSNEERTLREEQFHEVGMGEGTYSKDPQSGAYYPDENGNYVRVVVPVGDPQPITKLSLSLRGNLSPVPVFSLDGAGFISEETKEDEKLSIYLLDLDKFQRDETTVFGKNSLELEGNLYPEEKLSLGARWSTMKEADNRTNGRHAKLRKTLSSLHLKRTITSQIGLNIETYQERDVLVSTEHGQERGEIGRGGSSTLSVKPVGSIELSLGVGGERRAIEEPYYYPSLGEVRVDRAEIFPRAVYAISHRGRVQVGSKVARRTSQLSVDALPPDIGYLHPPGVTIEWDLGLTYELSSYLTSNVYYQGERRPGAEVRHSGEAGVRAYF